MSFLGNISLNELPPLLQIVQQSLSIRKHYELFNWLQEDVQHFLPHDIMIASWGDFSLGMVCYDIVSPLPGMRTDAFDDREIRPFITSLFNRWLESGHSPYMVNTGNGFEVDDISNPAASDALKKMNCALVHGIKDQRGRHDCLYILCGPSRLGTRRSRDALCFLLPYVDTAFRQIAHLPEQYLAEKNEANGSRPANQEIAPPPHGLSAREMDIMEWVRKGKTNQEIGMILEISAFTVKNHLQRIFKKLDVINRAQAVAKIEVLTRHAGK